jgi:hypothetical protein
MNGLTLQDIVFDNDAVITVNPDTLEEQDDRTITIPKGTYTKSTLISTLTDLLNRSFSSADFDINTLEGFEWRCGYTQNNSLLISYRRIDNDPKAPFQQTLNITNPTPGFYKRGNDTIDNNAFIISTLPTNRGNSKTTINITGGALTTQFLAGITLTPSPTGIASLPIANYKYGVICDPTLTGGSNLLKVILNGQVGITVGTGFNPTQYDKIELSHYGSSFKVRLFKDGAPIMLTTQTIGPVDLYTNYYTAITLKTDTEQFSFQNYYPSPYTTLNNNKVIETVQIPDEEIKNLNVPASIVKLSFTSYSGDLLGFPSENPIEQFKSDGTFTGTQNINFSAIQDCVVEILSLSQLESYDTQVGYRRPIIYIFDTLGIDTSGSAYGNVDYPIFISLENESKYLISSMTVRISSNNHTFDISDYTSLLLLIED